MLKNFSVSNCSFFLLLLFSGIFPASIFAQGSEGKFQRDGDEFFEKGDYRSALRMYRQAGLETSKNKKARLRLGISLWEINDVDGALRIFQSLVNEGKTEAPVFFYMGKCLQAKKYFPEAITNYKKFLQRTESNDPLRSWVKDELTRCANGSRLKFADQIAYVENAGTTLNTQFAEFGVKNSPTTIDKIYFNSNRTSESTASFTPNLDIYSTALDNGKWTTPSPLTRSINNTIYDEVAGFSTDGQIIYYVSAQQGGYKILTDTFSDVEGMTYKGVFSGPFDPGNGGSDIFFFNDTISLFSMNVPGGYGGYDLYISVYSNGRWSRPANVGPAINGFYNERFPFLTRDGKTLFYSSDNLESVGGYDIFRCSFDPAELTWSHPENVGFPINSTSDDTHIVLSPDAMTAFISSNRKESHGDFDLYRVFFKQPVHAHQSISFVPTFYQTIMSTGAGSVVQHVAERPLEVKEYYVSHLFIDENADVLTPQNTKKLDLLANLMLIYPKIISELTSYQVPSGQRAFSLYFSIKKAEKAAEYLERKGVPRNRILLKGYGFSFPLAINPGGAINSPVYLKLNNRIEIGLHDFETEPVITHLENIPVPENLQDPLGKKFTALRHSLYYSVQIASISQILQNQSLEAMEEVFIDVDNARGNYRYMSGMMPTFMEAEVKLKEMIKAGFTDSFIVPYFDGRRLTRDQIPGYTTEFPDLLLFLSKTQ